MKRWCAFAAALTFVLGVTWLACPDGMFGAPGVQTDAAGTYVARRHDAEAFPDSVQLGHLPPTAG